MTSLTAPEQGLTQRFILRFWLPLAAMWLLMALEQPTLSAVIARLPDPVLNLAAWGLTFSLALIVESPVIMFLTMSTALARSRQSYQFLLRFVHLMAWGLTALHLAIGLSPAYGLIVGELIGAPPETIELSRVAFLLMLPWSGAIAYRRFWQGVLIRHGRPRALTVTTTIRLTATAVVALAGLAIGRFPGAYVAGAAVSVGVLSDMTAAYLLTRSTIREHLAHDKPGDTPLTWPILRRFYLPLALTSFINLAAQPIVSIGLSRAPLPLESLAVWPVLTGLLFLLRSSAFALQEVIVALFRDETSYAALRRFSSWLAVALTAAMAVVTLTPLSRLWFLGVAGLDPALAALAVQPALLLSLTPGLSALISWQRGVLIHYSRTSPITVATVINMLVLMTTVIAGAEWLAVPGVMIAAAALALSLVAETAYLAWRARGARQEAPALPLPA